MDSTQSVIAAQYRASLAMLRDAIEKCTDELWCDQRHDPAYWRIAYHTLFFTDLYLSENHDTFCAWDRHVKKYEALDPLVRIDGDPYTRADLSGYTAHLTRTVEERVAGLDLAGPSGMSWLSFTKLELQFYNIRHIHHHAGQLTVWLREELGSEIDWVGTV